MTRSGPPSGEQDRSIRKNSAPSGSGPSGLHYGRNDNVLPSPKETGRPPARPLPSSAADQCRLGPRDLPLSCCDVAPWVKPSIGVPIQPPTPIAPVPRTSAYPRRAHLTTAAGRRSCAYDRRTRAYPRAGAGARTRRRQELALACVVLNGRRPLPAPAAGAGLAPAHIRSRLRAQVPTRPLPSVV